MLSFFTFNNILGSGAALLLLALPGCPDEAANAEPVTDNAPVETVVIDGETYEQSTCNDFKIDPITNVASCGDAE